LKPTSYKKKLACTPLRMKDFPGTSHRPLRYDDISFHLSVLGTLSVTYMTTCQLRSVSAYS
jgi:hypothetical protein